MPTERAVKDDGTHIWSRLVPDPVVIPTDRAADDRALSPQVAIADARLRDACRTAGVQLIR